MDLITPFRRVAENFSDSTSNVLGEMTENVIDGACSIRNKYPNRFRKGGVLTPVLDRLCGERGHSIPASPSVPFAGGQCCDVTYQFNLRLSYERCDGNVKVDDFFNRATGKIIGGFMRQSPNSPGRTQLGFIVENCQGEQRYVVNQDLAAGITSRSSCPDPSSSSASALIISDSFSWSITDLEVSGGGDPEACGNPPSQIPDDPEFDASDFSRTVQICGSPDDPDDQRCVNVTIDFDPELDENGSQCYSIDGARYCLTPDGIEKQDDEKISDETPPEIDDLETTAEEDSEDAGEDDEAIEYVTTEITTFPYKGKAVLQSNADNNDYFAGYFNWITSRPDGEYRHPTIPVRKRMQIFARPPSATGYRAYTVNGAKLKIVVYKQNLGE